MYSEQFMILPSSRWASHDLDSFSWVHLYRTAFLAQHVVPREIVLRRGGCISQGSSARASIEHCLSTHGSHAYGPFPECQPAEGDPCGTLIVRAKERAGLVM